MTGMRLRPVPVSEMQQENAAEHEASVAVRFVQDRLDLQLCQ